MSGAGGAPAEDGAARPAPRPRARAALLLLAVVVSAALALRVWYLPAPGRFDGETATIANIESRLAGRQLRYPGMAPLGWIPQLLTIRAADRLHEVTGAETLHVTTAKGRVTRRGVVLLRGLALLPAVAGLLLLYAIARRLHTAAVALLAVLILGFSPWHVQASVSSGPEVLTLALSALALWLALRALDEPSPARFALVGAALGAAVAARASGALIAVPVLLGLILGGRRGWRRAALALAITVPLALAVWWALTPPWSQAAAALAHQRADEAARAAREMSSRFTVAVLGFLLPLRDAAHGRLLGALALLGAAGQAFRCLFLVDPGPARGARLMVLSAAPVLVLGTAWATPLYRESDFVPLLLFSSLYAAVLLGILWEGLVELLPRLRAPLAAVAAAGLVAALVVPPAWGFVRSRVVGSTIGAALDWLRRDFRDGLPRLVVVEEAALGGGAEDPLELAAGIGLRLVPRLAAMAPERLARADGAVFLRAEPGGPRAAAYRVPGAPGTQRRAFAGSLLWRRGPDLVALRHAHAAGSWPPIELRLEGRGGERLATVPAVPGAGWVSLALWLPPAAAAAPAAPRAALGGVEIDLAPAGRSARGGLFLSERLPAAPEPRRLVIEPPPWLAGSEAEIGATLYLWP